MAMAKTALEDKVVENTVSVLLGDRKECKLKVNGLPVSFTVDDDNGNYKTKLTVEFFGAMYSGVGIGKTKGMSVYSAYCDAMELLSYNCRFGV